MAKICEVCKLHFDGKGKRFCSWRCRNLSFGGKWRGHGKFVNCSYCKKKIWRKNHLIKTFAKFYCNKICQNKYKSEITNYDWCTGDRQWNWKGGISFLGKKLYKQIRKKRKYILWRKAVFERDKYTCQNCGEVGKKLNVDHIKPFSEIVKENKLENIKDMYKCKKLWDISNGRTLCEKCHLKIGWRGSHVKNC